MEETFVLFVINLSILYDCAHTETYTKSDAWKNIKKHWAFFDSRCCI